MLSPELLEDRVVPAMTITAGNVAALISAMNTANTDGQPTTIILNNKGTYNVTSINNFDSDFGETFANGLPQVMGNVTIVGNGSTIERSSSAAAFRLFYVGSGGSLTLDNLTVTGGEESGDQLAMESIVIGGAIFSIGGNLNLNGVTVSGNSVVGSTGQAAAGGSGESGDSGGSAEGGGIYAFSGSVKISDSLIENNTAVGGAGGAGGTAAPGQPGQGGSGGNGGQGYGAGLGLFLTTLTLNNTKVSGNDATVGAGGVGANGLAGTPGGNGSLGAGQPGGPGGTGTAGMGTAGASPDVFGSSTGGADTVTPLKALSAATINAFPHESTGSVLLATFTQGSATQSASAYSALVDWGDSQADISTEANPPVTIVVSGQTISVYGSHTYATGGSYKLSVTLYTGDTESVANPTVNVANDVTSQVTYKASGLVYNRATKEYGGTITLTNNGTTTISGELYIVFTGLPAGVTLANASGTDDNGNPYLLVNVGTLARGKSFTFSVFFSDPSNEPISYMLQILEQINNQQS
jgi:hypothetical protein